MELRLGHESELIEDCSEEAETLAFVVLVAPASILLEPKEQVELLFVVWTRRLKHVVKLFTLRNEFCSLHELRVEIFFCHLVLFLYLSEEGLEKLLVVVDFIELGGKRIVFVLEVR